MKKVIVILLILIIISALGIIGYLIYSQNTNLFNKFLRSKTGEPSAPISLFPIAPITEDNKNLTIGTTTGSTAQALGVPDQPELSQMAIASIAVIPINKTLRTLFTARESGNIYALDDQNNLNRLSNITLPAMGESYFGSDTKGWRSILRQEKGGQIYTQIGTLNIPNDISAGPFELKTTNWINHLALTISPDGKKIAYLEEQKDGSANLYTSDWDLKNIKRVWSSPLSEWRINWPEENLINITSRASFDYPGVSYNLNLKTGKSAVILSNLNGLSTNISPDGKKMLYTKSLLNSFSLYQYNVASSSSRLLDLNTLPEKCAWLDGDILYCAVPKTIVSGRYPDEWYQGKINFSDNIWRVDLKQNTTLLTYQLKGDYDLINLVINKETSWLYALDKKSNKLQAFNLKP